MNIKIITVGKYSKYIKGINFNDVDELIDYLKDKYGVDVSLIQAENISSIFLKNYRKK